MIRSEIVEIGEMAFFEGYPILILFNESAPPGLREVCVIHRFIDEIDRSMLMPGSKIRFGEQEYAVEQIGKVANETLYDLGHASLYFGWGQDQEVLPGAIVLNPYVVPEISVGDEIRFIK